MSVSVRPAHRDPRMSDRSSDARRPSPLGRRPRSHLEGRTFVGIGRAFWIKTSSRGRPGRGRPEYARPLHGRTVETGLPARPLFDGDCQQVVTTCLLAPPFASYIMNTEP